MNHCLNIDKNIITVFWEVSWLRESSGLRLKEAKFCLHISY